MRQGIHYDEAYAPTPGAETVRLFFGLSLYRFEQLINKDDSEEEAAAKWIACHAGDVEQAFINATLNRKVYMKQPPMFKEWCEDRGVKWSEDFVILLKKAQYGMTDAARLWFELLI